MPLRRQWLTPLAAAAAVLLLAPAAESAQWTKRRVAHHDIVASTAAPTLADAAAAGVDTIVNASRLLAAALEAGRDWQLRCARRAAADEILRVKAEDQQATAEAAVSKLDADILEVRNLHQELVTKAELLSTRIAERAALCSHAESSRNSQRQHLDQSTRLADNVADALEDLPASAVGRLPARWARVQGSLRDEAAHLGHGGGLRAGACAEALRGAQHELAVNRAAQVDADRRLQTLIPLQAAADAQRVRTARDSDAETERRRQRRAECEAEAAMAEASVEALRSRRRDLLRASGRDAAEVIDCEVTPWRDSACTVLCGGGVRNLTREVMQVPSAEGAPCPDLHLTVPCNSDPCSQDCQMGAWAEWGACSASCGGGRRARQRRVLRNSTGASAVPCGLLEAVEVCGAEPCAESCALGDWGPWGPCTKACGGGQRGRQRNSGKASPGCSEGLVAFETCQEAPCNATGQFHCSSDVDLVVVMDGSELLPLEDFEEELAFVGELIDRFAASGSPLVAAQEGPQAGALIVGAGEAGEEEVVMPLSGNAAALKAKILAGRRGHGGKALEQGLAAAGRLLRSGGRQGTALGTVLVLLQGEPDSVALATAQSRRLQEELGARVVVAAAGCLVDARSLQQLASEPASENFLRADSFAALRRAFAERAGEVAAGLCSVVGPGKSAAEGWLARYLPFAPAAPPAPAPEPAPVPTPAGGAPPLSPMPMPAGAPPAPAPKPAPVPLRAAPTSAPAPAPAFSPAPLPAGA